LDDNELELLLLSKRDMAALAPAAPTGPRTGVFAPLPMGVGVHE
jgi:hypothetical protein